MHTMERTPKIITIVGLVMEGLAALVTGVSAILFSMIDRIPGYSESLLEMTPDELEAYEFIMDFTLWILVVFAILFTVMFIINITLFTKLIKGNFTKEQARKVYLYQAIWGGICVLINTVTGILYLVSGIQGYNEQVDRIETRDGI